MLNGINSSSPLFSIAFLQKSKEEATSVPLVSAGGEPPSDILDSLVKNMGLQTLPSIKVEAGQMYQPESTTLLKIGVNFLAGGTITGGDGALSQDGLPLRPAYKIWEWLINSLINSLSDDKDSQAFAALKKMQTGVSQIREFLDDIQKLFAGDWKENEKALVDVACKYAQKIRGLTAGHSQMFSSAWINRAGGDAHVVLTEVIRRDDGNFDLNVYTSTGFQLAGNKRIGDKLYQEPVVRYQNIPESHLLLTSDSECYPVFIQSIIEVQALASWDVNRKVGEEDVLECLDYLAAYYVQTDLNSNTVPLITGQRDGTCVPSSTKAWARVTIGDISIYKQVIFHLEFRLLIALFHSMKDELEDIGELNSIMRRFFTESARNIMRKVNKLAEGVHTNHALVGSYMTQVTVTSCNEILSYVEKATQKVSEQLKQESDQAKLEDFNPAIQQENVKQLYFFGVMETDPGKVVGASTLLSSKHNNMDYKLMLQEIIDLSHKGELRGALTNLEINSRVDALPLPKGPYDSISWRQLTMRSELTDMIDLLYNVSKKYAVTMSLDCPARRYTTLLSLQILIHHLAVKVDDLSFRHKNAKIGTYKLRNFHQKLGTVYGLLYLDSKVFDRLQKVKTYITKFNKVAGRDNLFPLEGGAVFLEEERSTSIEKYDVLDMFKNSIENGVFFKALINSDSTLKTHLQEVSSNDERFADLNYKDIIKKYQLETTLYENYLKQLEVCNNSKNAEQDRKKLTAYDPPRYIVNIPEDTKMTALCQEMQPTKTHPFEVCGYGYINKFRNITYDIAQSFLKRADQHHPLQLIAKRESCYDYGVSCASITENTKSESFEKQAISYYTGPLNDEHLNLIYNDYRLRRNISMWNRGSVEGYTLKKGQSSDFLEKLIRALSEWRISPYQLIYEASQEFEKFSDASLQTLFKLLFFRSPIENKQEHIGAGKLLLKESALRDNALKFISEGLNYFYQHKKNVQAARFFFDFAYHIGQYLVDGEIDANKFCKIEAVNHWLSAEDIKKKERSALHLNRILFYSLKSEKLYSKEDLIEIYTSWTYCQLNPESAKNQPYLSYKSAESFIVKLTSRLNLDSDVHFSLVTGILKKLGLDGMVKGETWDLDTLGFPIFHNGDEKEFVKFNLLEGKIYTRDGALQVMSGDPAWEQEEDFLRLFHGKSGSKFEYYAVGETTICFQHPQMGIIKVVPPQRATLFSTKQHAFLRTFSGKGDRWYQYIDIGDEKAFPEVLRYDHTFWSPIDNDDNPEGVFCSLKTYQPKYEVATSGEIHLWKNSALTVANLSFADKTRALENFDCMTNILLFMKDKKVVKVEFPRYHFEGGQKPLTFIKDARVPNRFVWKEHKGFYLKREIAKGALGTIGNYLELEPVDEKGATKLLVPFQAIEPSLCPSTKSSLNITNNKPLMPIAAEREPVEREGIFQYFVYNCQDGVIEPTTLESRLYLAYMYFSQKRYVDAIEQINTIKPTEKLSGQALKILEMIETLGEGESHPEGKLTRLHALKMRMRTKDEAANEQERNYFGKEKRDVEFLWKACSCVKDYMQTLNNASFPTRLTRADEHYVLNNLEKELEAKRHYLYSTLALKSVQINEMMLILKTRITSLSREAKDTSPSAYSPSRFITIERCKVTDKMTLLDPSAIKTGVRVDVSWLGDGEECSMQVTRPPRRFHIWKNGTLLLQVLKLAKKEGSSKAKINAMLFRLLMWRLHVDECKEVVGIDLLLAILYQPDHFSDPIDCKSASYEDKKHFVQQLEKTYQSSEIRKKSCGELYAPIFSQKLGSKRSDKPASSFPPKLSKSVFDTKEIKRSDFGVKSKPIDVEIDPSDQRWNELAAWKREFLKEQPKGEAPKNEDLNCSLEKLMLRDDEKQYTERLASDLQALQQEYEEGQAQIEGVPLMTIERVKCGELHHRANSKIRELQQEQRALRANLMKLANKEPHDENIKVQERARLGGGVKKALLFQNCVDALLTMDERAFQVLNPHLDSSDIKEIAKLTVQLLDLKSYEAQLERVNALVEKIQAYQDLENAVSAHYTAQLAAVLDARYHFGAFDDQTKVALHIFSGQTGIIPYEKQTRLIKKMLEVEKTDSKRFKNIVIQLIMGGGKTSVLATIFLNLSAARQDRIALFLVPAPLFETVCSNFSDSTKLAFNKDVLSIDVVRKDLTNYKLDQIWQTLKRAQNSHVPIVMKATTIQCFELEFLIEARRFAQLQKSNADQIELLTLRKRVQLLGAIVSEIKERGDAVLDEEDLLLAHNTEVIFPSGQKLTLDTLENYQLKIIFEALTSDELKVPTLQGTPTVNEVVGMRNKKGATIEKGKFIKHVLPVVVRELFEKFEPLRNSISGFKASFKRYLSGEMPNFLQMFADDINLKFSEMNLNMLHPDWKASGDLKELENDVIFLRHLSNQHSSKTDEGREVSSLASSAKFYLQQLIPDTLEKVGQRDFGAPDEKDGRHGAVLVPYDAALTPSPRAFGNHREHANYQYKYAAAFTTSKEQILEMAEGMRNTAEFYMGKEGEEFKETAEYQQFKKIFGVCLDEISQPGKVEQAQAFIENDVKTKLEIEYEVVAQHITYNSETLNSDAMSLISALSSTAAMSGTTSNAPGLLKSLAERHERDAGTEGKIWSTLLKGANIGSIHENEFNSIERLLGSVLDEGTPEHARQIRGIIETGGQFVQFGSNKEVAKQIAAVLEERKTTNRVDEKIEGVLFFHKGPSEINPNTLYIWKLGALVPERIGGSSKEALARKGLKPENYFVFYDENHTTGTDILQVPDAINLLTFDKKLPQRALAQGAMRLRQLLSSQEVEFLITPRVRSALVRQGQTVKDLILSAFKEQSIARAKSMVRYFTQQINNIFRSRAVKALLDAALNKRGFNETNFCALLKQLEPFFVTTVQDDPYLMFGRLLQEVDTKKMLIELLESKVDLFVTRVSDQELVSQVQFAANEMKSYITSVDSLPETCESSTLTTGIQQEMVVQQEQHVQQEVEIETEVELEQGLQDELLQYQFGVNASIFVEKGWDQNQFLNIVENLKKGKELQSLKEQLASFKYQSKEKRMEYKHCFSEPIFGTHAYFNTLEGESTLPVFHKLQRPAKQILAVKVGKKMHWLLLSEFETNNAKVHLKKLYEKKSPAVKDVWLVQPDASLLVEGEDSNDFPYEEGEVKQGLFEINAFAGHASYISTHHEEAEEWLESYSDLKVRFIKLRVGLDKKEQAILRYCPAIGEKDTDAKRLPTFYLHQARIAREKERKGTRMIRADEGDKLSVNKVAKLHVDCIKFLKTKEQIQHLQPFQVPYIIAEQLQYLPANLIEHLKDPVPLLQNKYLNLSDEQMNALTEKQCHFIKYLNPEQYSKFNKEWQIAAVACEHVNWINKKQWFHLSKDQVQSLSADDLSALTIPAKYAWVKGDCIAAIPAQYLVNVTRAQIKEITDSTLIPKLEEIAAKSVQPIKRGTWSSWLAPDMVEHINADQLPYLCSPKQVEALPVEWTKNLRPKTQVPYISFEQASHLVGKAQIQCCPDKLLQYINVEQIQHVENEKLCYLARQDQVQAVANDKVCYLSAEASDGLSNQILHLTDEQCEYITDTQVKGLSIDRLPSLCEKMKQEQWNKIVEGLQEEQIAQFDTEELVALLSKDQIATYLTEKQVPLITHEWQIQLIKQDLVKNLKKEQIKFITRDQVPFLKKRDQVEQVTDGLIKHLRDDHVKWLTPEQVAHIDQKQVTSLSGQEQIRACPNHLVCELPPLQVVHITQEQVSHLKHPDAIKACPNVLVQHLDPQTQVRHISETQVPHLVGRAQIQACPCILNHIQCLDPSQVKYVSNEQLQYVQSKEQIQALLKQHFLPLRDIQYCQLSSNQISQMNSEKEIARLSVDQVASLDEKQIPLVRKLEHVHAVPKRFFMKLRNQEYYMLDKRQIDQMDSVEMVEKLAPAQIKHLKDSQVRHIRKKEHINAVIKSHFSSLRDEEFAQLSKDQVELIDCQDQISRLSFSQLKYLSEKQIAKVDFNKLEVKPPHPLFGRILPINIESLNVDRIQYIAEENLQYLKSAEQIQSASYRQVEFLTREQLKKRTWGQFLAYAVGVVALGLVGSIVALVAYLTIIPIGYFATSMCGGSVKGIRAVVDEHPARLYRYIAS